jgi:predicted type IV restriction endonuclease
MQQLNLPPFEAKISTEKGKSKIFDVVRKKYIVLTPEEWVRQHFIHFMLNSGYPASLMAVERLVVVNSLRQRADIVIFNRTGNPAMIVECKAPSVELDNKTIWQAARYNIPLGVKYLVITNGLKTYCIRTENSKNQQKVLEKLPLFEEINDQHL